MLHNRGELLNKPKLTKFKPKLTKFKPKLTKFKPTLTKIDQSILSYSSPACRLYQGSENPRMLHHQSPDERLSRILYDVFFPFRHWYTGEDERR